MKKRMTCIVMGLIIAANAGLLAGLFYQPGDIFSDKPIATADFTFHYHFARMGRVSMEQARAVWGYDPTFMAGALYTPAFSSNYALKLAAFALPFLSVAVIIKLAFLISLGVIPWIIHKTALNLGLDGPESVLAALIAFAYLWLGLPLEIAPYGMFLHVAGAAWGIFVLGWWARLLETGETRAGAGVALSAALLFVVHVGAPIWVAMAALLAFVMYFRRMDRRRLLWATGGGSAALLLALPWLGAFMAFVGLRTSSANDLQTPGLTELWALLQTGHASLEALMLVLGAIGFYKWREKEPARRWAPAALCAVFLSALYMLGGVSDMLAQMTPRRIAVPIYLLLTLPAAVGMKYIWTGLRPKLKGGKGLAVSAASLLVMAALLWPGARGAIGAMGSIRTGTPVGALSLLDWMKESTGNSGRIMIEDSIHSPKPGLPDGMTFLGIIPAAIDRQFVGGPFPFTYIKPHVVNFQDGKLLEKPLGDYDEEDLRRILVDFNIEWAVSHSRAAYDGLAAWPMLLRPSGQIGAFVVWETQISTGGFFLKGAGTVEAKTNEIKVTGSKPVNGEVILKYQWMPCLKVAPSGRIRAVEMSGLPVEFISVVGAPPDFSVTPDYSHPWFPACAP